MAELLTTYTSLRLQEVDACVIPLAERLDLHEVAALDRRDFQIVAPPPPAQRREAQAVARRLIRVRAGRAGYTQPVRLSLAR
jgi:hypothetical protein